MFLVASIVIAVAAFWLLDVQTARPPRPNQKCGRSERHRAMFRPKTHNPALRRLARVSECR